MSLPTPAPPRLRDLDWCSALAHIALVLLVTRLLGLAVVMAVEATYDGPEGLAPERSVMSILTLWDGQAYLSIAEHGHHATIDVWPNYAFYPAYPLTIRAASILTGGDFELAALVASNVAFALVLVVLFALSTRHLTRAELVSRSTVQGACFRCRRLHTRRL